MQRSFRDLETSLDITVNEQIQTVEQLAEQFIQSIRGGHAPEVDDYVAMHPEFAAQIRELFPTILVMEQLRMQSLSSRRDGRVQRDAKPIKQLGDFKIVREIGRGGMGIVYQAIQQSLGRKVALKVLPNNSFSQSRVEQFKRESRLAANLHHTNIVQIYGVGEDEGLHYFVMQLIDGTPLSRFVSRWESGLDESRENAGLLPALTKTQVCEIGIQAAKALHFAHLQGIFHRDVKPANLILDHQNHVWVTDFGLAIAMDQTAVVKSETSIPGTLYYLPPEKLSGQLDTNQTDIYSLGITLIELLLRGPAFEYSTRDELIQRINSGQTRKLTHADRPLPRDLEAILKKAVSVDPNRRYQTAKRFASDLQNYLEGRPVSCRRLSKTYQVSRWMQRNPAMAAMACLVAVLMLAISAVSTTGFFRVQSALKSESAQRRNAEDASRLASRALDKIFSRFSPDSQFVETDRQLNLTQPVLSDEVVAMLEDLLVFYQQLAASESDDPGLAYRASLAQCRVGEINERLGNYQLAEKAYLDALADFEQMDESDLYVLQKARIYNQLGFVSRTVGDAEKSARFHRQAIKELGKPHQLGDEPTQQLGLELARTYYYMGHQVKPGFGPNSLPPAAFGTSAEEVSDPNPAGVQVQAPPDLTNLKRAVAILESIRASSSSIEATKRYLLSLCYREIASDNWDQRTEDDIESDRRSIAILEKLIDDYPKEASYRFALMQTLAEINVFEPAMKTETLQRANRSLARALEIGDQLVEIRPDIAAYRLALTHACFKQATICDRLGKVSDAGQRDELFEEASRLYRKAMTSQSYLVRRYPEQLAYRVWLARFSLSLAKCESLKSRVEQRDRFVGRALANLVDLPAALKDTPEVQALLAEADPFAN